MHELSSQEVSVQSSLRLTYVQTGVDHLLAEEAVLRSRSRELPPAVGVTRIDCACVNSREAQLSTNSRVFRVNGQHVTNNR